MTTQMHMPWLKTITQINPAKELHDLRDGAYLAYDRDEDEEYGLYLEYEELAFKYLMDVLQISVPIEYDSSEDLACQGLEGYYYVVEAIFQHVHRLRKPVITVLRTTSITRRVPGVTGTKFCKFGPI